jgi:hypothetical protein
VLLRGRTVPQKIALFVLSNLWRAALEGARGSGHPMSRMHTHVTYTRLHTALLAVDAALLAVGKDPVAPYQKSMHTWIKFLASRIE